MKRCGWCNHRIWRWQELSIVSLAPSGEAALYVNVEMATYVHEKCRIKHDIPLWRNSDNDKFLGGRFRYR